LLDKALGGDVPFTFHLSVVLVHAATAALVCLLGLQLLGRDGFGAVAALFAGLLFALHPIHTESVAWVAGRSDVLATGFLVAALVVRSSWPGSWTHSATVGLLAFAALGAKETGVAVYPLMVLQDVLTVRRSVVRATTASWARRYSGPLAAGLLYFLLRRATLGELVGSAPGEDRPGGAVMDVVAAFAAYLGKLLWPLGLNAYIDQIPGGVISSIAAIALLLAAVLAAVRLWQRDESLPLFLVLWVLLTLAPSLTIVWKIPDAPMAERYLYLPSVGFCLLVGYVVKRLAASARPAWIRPTLVALCVSLLAASAVATVRRNRTWSDDIVLWEDAARKSRRSGMAFRSLATAYQKAGRDDEARRYFEQALQRRNDAKGLQIIYNNLGTLAMQDQNFGEAAGQYRKALEANPDAPDTLFNLGLAVFHAGDRSEPAARQALEYYRRAEQLSPYDPDVQAGLGQVLLVVGDEEEARQHMQRALDLGVQEATAVGIRRMLEKSIVESR
jgi:tetratricopeptide (TPR) repeat protein